MEAYKEIISRIYSLSGKYQIYDIFSDWVEMMALSIQNGCDRDHGKIWTARETKYKNIIRKYDKEEQKKFCDMFALLAKAFEEQIEDVLGKIYMECMCNGKQLGQFFTPFHISVLLAELGKTEEDIILSEPSCGGGGMIIAVAAVLKERSPDYIRRMDVVAQDIDLRSVYMCYVQLSLLGIKASVLHGNALSSLDERMYAPEKVLRTPKKMGVFL